MQILKDPRYYTDLTEIMEFIAQDSIQSAIDFQNELDKMIENCAYFPYKHRQSIYFDDKNIRDLIIKGYVVPYVVDDERVTLTVLGIIKWKSAF